MRLPAEHQMANLRDELHRAIDDLLDNWPFIHHQARTMGGGYQADTLAGGSRSASTDPMLNRIHAMRNDLGERSQRWLTQLDIFIRHARQLHDQQAHLVPLDDAEVEEARVRKSTVEKCARCLLPIIDGKIHRIDGEPHHANTCYYQAWRERRANVQTA